MKKSIMNADRAYKNFLSGKAGFPNFKRRNGRPVSMYLPRNSEKELEIKRHKGKIPILGWVRFKEYGYVPVKGKAISVTITKQAGRYYVSFLFKIDEKLERKVKSASIGIDLGIKSFAVISDGRNYININRTDRIKKLTRRLKREQRKFSRKIKKIIRRKEKTAAKRENRSNLDKQRLKVQRAYKKLADKRRDYINKTVYDIITARPEYITIEDLNVSGMMKNRHLSREIAACEFWYFRELLERKCRTYEIELRIADRFYASSKNAHIAEMLRKI